MPALMPPPARRNPVRRGRRMVKPVSTAAENARSGPRGEGLGRGVEPGRGVRVRHVDRLRGVSPHDQRAPVGEADADVSLPGHRRVGQLADASAVTHRDGDRGLGSLPGPVDGQGEGPAGRQEGRVHRRAARDRAHAVDLGGVAGEDGRQLGALSDEDPVIPGVEAGDRRRRGAPRPRSRRLSASSGSRTPAGPSARREHEQHGGDAVATAHRVLAWVVSRRRPVRPMPLPVQLPRGPRLPAA